MSVSTLPKEITFVTRDDKITLFRTSAMLSRKSLLFLDVMQQ